LGLPVIGGNVSLYNESGGVDIDPTPVVGLLGVIDSLIAPPPGWAWREGDDIVLVGTRHANSHHRFPLGGSRWATRRGRRGGHIAHFDAETLSAAIDFVVAEIAPICGGEPSDVTAVHDVGGGGIAVAVAEMVAVTGLGATLVALESHGELFTEFPGRFIMATNDLAAFVARADRDGVEVMRLGTVGGTQLRIGSMIDLGVDEIATRRRGALEESLAAAG
jgi:phosphoribosylformylglycinamidine (FGAM) synthase-like enzyme